jgi:multicomponent Na+:H+ antiporter subunit E
MSRAVRMVLSRLVLFGALWSVLAGADWSHPAMAVATVAAATAASLVLWRPAARRLQWGAVPALLLFFLWNSVKGGIDVARRVFSPSLPIRPEVIDYHCTIDHEGGRVLFVWMIGLMPGTAGVGWGERGRVPVHVIDRGMYNADDLRCLENRLLAVFGGGASR